MRLAIDGIVFQKAGAAGSARSRGAEAGFWQALIETLDESNDLVLLDRGDGPRLRRGVSVPFPVHRGSAAAADSILLQKVGEAYRCDLFLSTGDTMPLAMPTIAVVCGDPAARPAGSGCEGELALAFARRICVPAAAVKRALLAHPPGCPAGVIGVEEVIGVDEMIAVDEGSGETRFGEVGRVLALRGCDAEVAALRRLAGEGEVTPLDPLRAADQLRGPEGIVRRAVLLPDSLEALALRMLSYSLRIPVLSFDGEAVSPEACGNDGRGGETLRLRHRSLASLAACVEEGAALVLRHAREGRYEAFFRQWSHLRSLQARVEVNG